MRNETRKGNETMETTGLKSYCRVSGDAKPDAQIEARLGHYGKHYYLTSQVQLSGRGIVLRRTLTASDLTPQAQAKVGWHEYKVTLRAFDRICRDHAVAYEMLLD